YCLRLVELVNRNRQRLAAAHCCPFDRRVERLALRPGHALAPLRRLRVAAEGEPRVLVAELVGRIADIVAADTAEAGVGPSETVERQRSNRRDPGRLELPVRDRGRLRENIAPKIRRVVPPTRRSRYHEVAGGHVLRVRLPQRERLAERRR